MDPRLTTLLEIQDLKAQIRELRSDPAAGRFETDEFNIDVEAAIATLESKMAELVASLDTPTRRRFERVRDSLGRVVVPVIEGVCYGCFVSVATATVGDPNASLRTCETCGRFIYILP